MCCLYISVLMSLVILCSLSKMGLLSGYYSFIQKLSFFESVITIKNKRNGQIIQGYYFIWQLASLCYRMFFLTTGNAAFTIIPVCHEAVSVCFSSVYCSFYYVLTHHMSRKYSDVFLWLVVTCYI